MRQPPSCLMNRSGISNVDLVPDDISSSTTTILRLQYSPVLCKSYLNLTYCRKLNAVLASSIIFSTATENLPSVNVTWPVTDVQVPSCVPLFTVTGYCICDPCCGKIVKHNHWFVLFCRSLRKHCTNCHHIRYVRRHTRYFVADEIQSLSNIF